MAENVEKRNAKSTRKRTRPSREHRVDVRFNDEELEVLDTNRNLCSMSRSAYIRSAALREVYARKANKPVTHNADAAKLVAAVNKVGVNVNQMARALNTANVGGLEMVKVLLSTRDGVKEVQESVDKLLAEVSDLKYKLEHDYAEREEELHDFAVALAVVYVDKRRELGYVDD